MRVLTTVAPRLSATVAAEDRFGYINATTVPSPRGGSFAIPDPGTLPATSTPALESSAASPRAAPGERAPPSSTTGRLPLEFDASVPRLRKLPKSPPRFAGEAVSTRSEVFRFGQRFTRAARTLSSRSVERTPGTSWGASEFTTSAGRSSLRATSLASNAASTPSDSAARPATSSTSLVPRRPAALSTMREARRPCCGGSSESRTAAGSLRKLEGNRHHDRQRAHVLDERGQHDNGENQREDLCPGMRQVRRDRAHDLLGDPRLGHRC